MNYLVRIINYLLVGQYGNDLKRYPDSISEDQKKRIISVSLYAPLTTMFAPFFIALLLVVTLSSPHFFFQNKKIFGVLYLSFWALIGHLFMRYYMNNELYTPVFEELAQLRDKERRRRRIIQGAWLFVSVFGSIALGIAIGLSLYHRK